MQKLKSTLKSWGIIGSIITFIVIAYIFWNIIPFVFAFMPGIVIEMGVFVVLLAILLSVLISAVITYLWLYKD